MSKKVFKDESMSILDLIDSIKTKWPHLKFEEMGGVIKFYVGDTEVFINHVEKKWDVTKIAPPGRANIWDLKSKENYSVVMLLFKLLEKGYSIKNIILEKHFPLGHGGKYLDVYLKNSNTVYVIEVKKNSEIDKYVSCKNPADTKQAISYGFQDKNTKVISYYTYNFNSDIDEFYNIIVDDTFQDIKSVDDFYDVWNQMFDREDYIGLNNVFEIPTKEITYAKLSEITIEDTKKIFARFKNLLRVHSVSDKPNAFMKFINLMLCKICDEVAEDTSYKVVDKNGNAHVINGLKCQYLYNIDTPEQFNLRLNELYQKGMDKYLNKKIIGYTDSDIQSMVRIGTHDRIKEAFTTLSLKYQNPFNFIEVYNEETFIENFLLLKGMVEIIQDFKFKYDYKQQFLGDFFEEMLNTSLKQDEGQFFTPMPMVDFIINSIPYEAQMIQKMDQGAELTESIPNVIDYACGAGHFLTSSMVKTQEAINNIANNKPVRLTNNQRRELEAYSDDDRQYFWVSETNVVGIEKDYRLAKTTKITTYLNGDGRATILNADGIDKFDSKDYAACASLYDRDIQNASKEPSHCINKFDYLISNPPYSVQGFAKNLNKNGIEIGDGTFSLFNSKYTEKNACIENLFVERAYQLLKQNGIAAVVLPQSVLTSDKYIDVRNFIYQYFKVVGLVMTSDLTFSGTTTSPVILFLKKLVSPNIEMNLDYETVVIYSPKYKNPKAKKVSEKEKQFLGYEFSSNKNSSGIKLLENPILETLHIYVQQAFLGQPIVVEKKDQQYVSLIKLNDMCIYDASGNKMIYPKYDKNIVGNPIKHYCEVNNREDVDMDGFDLKYLEIGDIENGNVNHNNNKSKTSTRFAKKGDILLSSLCPTADKIAIADDDYMVSTAIHVLKVKEGFNTVDILEKLRKDSTLEQMNSLLDGFKITYAKINESNLKNYIKI